MEGAPPTVSGQDRVPRIVLPVTRRGIVLDDRACWSILIAAMAASAALLLYWSRGVTFGIDELLWVYDSPGAGVRDLIEPHHGSLIATNRILYKAILETLGPDYVVFRLLWVASVLSSAALLYTLIKRWIGALPALAPAIVLLFFGSADEYFTSAIGFTALFAISAGLGALLLLERDDLRGDLGCCALLIVSVATFSLGLGFLVGVMISVLLRRDRASRAWIFLVPLVLYAAWWLWARNNPGSSTDIALASNILLIPSYIADSLAASLAALVGLNYEFDRSPQGGDSGLNWGYVLAAAAVAALAIRIVKGHLPRSLWVSLGIVLAIWTAGALVVGPLRPPDAPRYLYMGAVGVVLVASAGAARSVRFTRLGLAVLFLVAAAGLATNLELLRERSADVRDRYSAPTRASFAMLDLAREEVDPSYTLPLEDFRVFNFDELRAGFYLRAADQYGSLGLPLAELGRAGVEVREVADNTLVGAQGIKLVPTDDSPRGGCDEYRGSAVSLIELPSGGALLRNDGRDAGEVELGRFAEPSVRVGGLRPGESAELSIPPDTDPTPWRASIAGASSVEVCPRR